MICSVCQVKHEDAGHFGNWIKEDGEDCICLDCAIERSYESCRYCSSVGESKFFLEDGYEEYSGVLTKVFKCRLYHF